MPKIPSQSLGRSGFGNSRGFTLLELMVTLAVLAVLAGIAAPSFVNMIANTRLDSAASELADSFRYARSLAIERNQSMTVKPLDNLNFANGWGVYDSSVPTVALYQYEALDAPLSLVCVVGDDGCDGVVPFSPRGTAVTATFTVCDDRGQGRLIRVLLSGSVSRATVNGC